MKTFKDCNGFRQKLELCLAYIWLVFAFSVTIWVYTNPVTWKTFYAMLSPDFWRSKKDVHQVEKKKTHRFSFSYTTE